ncbi:RNA polymerase II transcription factor B 52 kDa subunit [Sorochytrium milnesiophthora]
MVVALNISTYLHGLPAQTFTRLYAHPATCLAVFRLLPYLAKQIVVRLLFVTTSTQHEEIVAWVAKSGQSTMMDSLVALRRFHILRSTGDTWLMHDVFRVQFRHALTGQGEQSSFGTAVFASEAHPVTTAYLDQYATEQWEAVLQFMVGTSTQRPAPAVINLLEKSGLMARRDGAMRITNSGFQFLLQNVNTQVWALLLQYLDLSEDLQMDRVDVLNFFFLLSSLELGTGYSLESLTETQQIMLEDLMAFGIVYRRKKKSKRYYPTRLATTLTTSHFGGSVGVEPGKGDVTERGAMSDVEQGFIIIETNYRVYAYTSSPLQIAILDLFIDIKARFPNMVSGVLSRDSVMDALKCGITADQIIQYLNAHAHQQMRKKNPVLPLTVLDQIRLWEIERNRVLAQECTLYYDLRGREFDALLDHATKLDAVLWSDRASLRLVIKTEAHESVREFFMRKKEQMKQQQPASSSSVSLL